MPNVLAVSPVLRSTRDSPRPLLADLLLDVGGGDAGVGVEGLGRLGDVALELVGGDELALARVPGVEHVGRGRAAQDARVDQAGELDVRDVPGRGVDAFEVPDSFGAVRVGC